MATMANQQPDETPLPLTPCPFCTVGFKRLGNHLPKCKDREGGDYSCYLSDKTLTKKTRRPRTRSFCPKCHKSFLRLDTHLRNNAHCRVVTPLSSDSIQPSSHPETPTDPPSTIPNFPPSLSHLHPSFSHLPPSSSHLASPTGCPPCADTPSPTSLPPQMLQFKTPLKLPCDVDWVEANSHFKSLVPAILEATTVDRKNDILTDGIYTYFSRIHGVRSKTSSRKGPSQQKHDRALKKVTELMTKARREFREAKQKGNTRDATVSIARNFLSLVRQQSQLRTKSNRSRETTTARRARKQCHHHFWRFARELLNNDAALAQILQQRRLSASLETHISQRQQHLRDLAGYLHHTH